MTGLPARPGRGALLVLPLLLMASGALRLGDSVGHAFASVGEGAKAGAAPLVCPEPPLALAHALSEREARVTAGEAALKERMAAMDLANQVIDQRIAALEQAEADLRKTVEIADGAAEGDLAQLTAVYQSMKPKEAAALFEKMDPKFAAGFLGRMKPEAAAAILSGMPADAGYTISVLLAGRNALAPRE